MHRHYLKRRQDNLGGSQALDDETYSTASPVAESLLESSTKGLVSRLVDAQWQKLQPKLYFWCTLLSYC